MNLTFEHPDYLWFLLILLPATAWYVYSWRRRHASMALSSVAPFIGRRCTSKIFFMHLMFALRLLAIAMLIVVIARPQTHSAWKSTTTNGTDIVLALDVSSSMLAGDFEPNRLEAAKKVAKQFISGREDDNIGLVIFAGESFTAVPMTIDHAQLLNYLSDVEVGLLVDNTAIGDGLTTSINRIESGKAKSKSIILLTDGSHNAGQVTPMDAAEIAASKGIKVYTIGIGRNGTAPYPQVDQFGRSYTINLPVVIDEKTLQEIASKTGGKYFRATNDYKLKDVFEEIDKLETTEISVRKYSHTEEDFLPWMLLALALLGAELLCRNLFLRSIP